MLLLVCFIIPVVFATSDTRETLNINGYIVNIDDKILKSVDKSSKLSDDLDLSGRELVGIHRKALNHLDNVKNLSLANNLLEKLPPLVFLALENLEYLNLSNNPLSEMKKIFVGLEKLQILDVSNTNEIYWNSDSYYGLAKSTLVRRGSQYLAVPASSHKNEAEPYELLCMNEGIVNSLQVAYDIVELRDAAKNCETAELDNFLINMKHSLSLRDRSIVGFNEGWYRLNRFANISHLDLTDNKISHITRAMVNDLPETLTHLILRNNNIESLERGKIVKNNLKMLDLRHNSITRIEDAALADTSLTELSLTSNKLENNAFAATLPSTLIQLSINDNNIVELLPHAFSRLNKLKFLDLDENKLVSLEKCVFHGLENIRKLSIAKNQLRQISNDSFDGLSDKMEVLNLDRNEIKILHRGTFINVPIVELDLSFNKIMEIESGTFDLPQLKTLKLNYNLLEKLKNDIILSLENADLIELKGNPIIVITARD